MERYAELLSEVERISASVELGFCLGVVMACDRVLEERSRESCADSWAFWDSRARTVRVSYLLV